MQIFLYIFLLLSIIQSKLILLIEYSRHGARSPENYHNPVIFPEGQKKITPEGLYQHYLIGTELRQRYIKDQTFLPATISPNTLEVKVYATSMVRTFSSAASQLLGLYPDNSGPELLTDEIERVLPPFNLSKKEHLFGFKTNSTPASLHGVGILMINQIHTREDLFFQGYEKAYCPKVAMKIDKILESPEIQKIMNEWKKNFFPGLSKILQRDWNFTLNPNNMNFSSVKDIYDLWASLEFHRRGYYLNFDNESLLNELKQAYVYVMYFVYEIEPLALKASLSLLMEDIIQKMTMKIKKSDIPEFNELKFVFYSGRDRQINALLSVLMEKNDIIRLKDHGIVFFASTLLIELHEDDENLGSWFVKLWFNDEPLKMKCGEEVGKCEFGRFLNRIKLAISDNIYRDCGSDTYRFSTE